jgi:hypothetical protein
MHTGPVPGNFVGERFHSSERCVHCKCRTLYFQHWESDCGGYNDVRYECKTCGDVYWVEGSDS